MIVRRFIAVIAVLVPSVALSHHANAYDQSFDYTSFETGFGQSQFNVLNYPGINGRFMMTSTDNHRPEMVANGNALAEFYNNFNADYNHPTAERRTPADEAAFINTYTINNSKKNGPRPDWLILNEISASQWQLNPGVPSLSEHRSWVIDTVTLLNDVYGYKVITYSPYETVGTGNAASWQALAAKSYVAIESYQSGTEVWNSGTNNAARLAWAQDKYQDSKDTYLAAGVPESRIFLSEHFGNTAATYTDNQGTHTTGWGRAGLASASDWDQVIMMRQDAIYNVGFAGFLAYNWGGNGMSVTQAEQIQHEYYYRSRLVLPTQKPQWLSDSTINVNGTIIPLSWSQPLNWLGGVPNASGAEVNFWRTNTGARSISLDGNKTVGELTFDSPNAFTITPGTGGTLTFQRSGGAILDVNQGNHAISAPVQLDINLSASIDGGSFSFNGAVTGVGGIVKTGAGTLNLAAPNSYGGDTLALGGMLRTTGQFLPDSTTVYIANGASLQLAYTGSADVVDDLYLNGVPQFVGTWGAPGSGAQFTSSLFSGTGQLQVSSGPLPGDFNLSGAVDTADFVLWRKKFGNPYTMDDYDYWRQNYGRVQAFGPGGGGGSPDDLSPVPEPSAAFLSLAAFAGILLYWFDGRSTRIKNRQRSFVA